MSHRLTRYTVDELTPAQRALYEDIVHGPRARDGQVLSIVDDSGALAGPFNAMLLSPDVGRALQEVGAAVRFRTSMPARAREIAILVVAYHWESAFEIHAHEAIGRAVGLSDDEFAIIRQGTYARLADPYERLVAETANRLLNAQDLDDEQFDAARSGLGLRCVFELSTLVGYYATLALQLRVFRVPGLV